MRKSALLLTTISLSACSPFGGGGDAPPPVTVVADSLCTVTSRYHATEAQKAAFAADKDLWRPLYQWLAGFNTERDKRCA